MSSQLLRVILECYQFMDIDVFFLCLNAHSNVTLNNLNLQSIEWLSQRLKVVRMVTSVILKGLMINCLLLKLI